MSSSQGNECQEVEPSSSQGHSRSRRGNRQRNSRSRSYSEERVVESSPSTGTRTGQQTVSVSNLGQRSFQPGGLNRVAYQWRSYQNPPTTEYFCQQRISTAGYHRVRGYSALRSQFVYFDCVTTNPVAVQVSFDGGAMNSQGGGWGHGHGSQQNGFYPGNHDASSQGGGGGSQNGGWNYFGPGGYYPGNPAIGNHGAWSQPTPQTDARYGVTQPNSGVNVICHGANTYNLTFGASGNYSVNLTPAPGVATNSSLNLGNAAAMGVGAPTGNAYGNPSTGYENRGNQVALGSQPFPNQSHAYGMYPGYPSARPEPFARYMDQNPNLSFGSIARGFPVNRDEEDEGYEGGVLSQGSKSVQPNCQHNHY